MDTSVRTRRTIGVDRTRRYGGLCCCSCFKNSIDEDSFVGKRREKKQLVVMKSGQIHIITSISPYHIVLPANRASTFSRYSCSSYRLASEEYRAVQIEKKEPFSVVYAVIWETKMLGFLLWLFSTNPRIQWQCPAASSNPFRRGVK